MKRLLCAVAVFLVLSFPFRVSAETIWYPLPPEAYQFGKKYPDAQKLLFAFDYGHALVYERLLLNAGQIPDPGKFEKEILTAILGILKNPPSTKVDESDIAPQYVFTFPLAVNILDWSHDLHQFVFDVMAEFPDRGEAFQRRIEALAAQYNGNKAVAITGVCKTMLFMDGQRVSQDGQRALAENEVQGGAKPYSKSFRRKFPSFNLLIWTYHWFQARLYEDLMKPAEQERNAAVAETLKKFWELLSDLPDSADFDMMPEVFKVAPTFAKMFPEISASFDTNHSMHDIISDILVSDSVVNKRNVGLGISRMALDPNAFRSKECPPQ